MSEPPSLDPDDYDDFGIFDYSNVDYENGDTDVPLVEAAKKPPFAASPMHLLDGVDAQLVMALRAGHDIRPPAPTNLHDEVLDELSTLWPGEYVTELPDSMITIQCRGCENFACVSAEPYYQYKDVSELEALIWFRNHNLLSRELLCPKCGAYVSKHPDDPICCTVNCPVCNTSMYFGPPLTDQYQRFSALQALLLVLCVAARVGLNLMCSFVDASRPTIARKKMDIFIALADSHVLRASKATILSGQGDETCFGRRKYNRGKQINESNHLWCQTLVSVDEEGHTIDAFLRPVPNRKAFTLVPWLQALLAPNARLVTDEFKSYFTMCAFVDHKKVCHKLEFKSADGFHTNNVEGFHGLIKSEVCYRGRKLGHGFVNRARYVTALAELVSAHIRGISPVAQIFQSLKTQLRSLRVLDLVGQSVRSWEVVPRITRQSTCNNDASENDNAQSDSSDDDKFDEEEVHGKAVVAYAKAKMANGDLNRGEAIALVQSNQKNTGAKKTATPSAKKQSAVKAQNQAKKQLKAEAKKATAAAARARKAAQKAAAKKAAADVKAAVKSARTAEKLSAKKAAKAIQIPSSKKATKKASSTTGKKKAK